LKKWKNGMITNRAGDVKPREICKERACRIVMFLC